MKPETFIANAKRIAERLDDEPYSKEEAKQLLMEYFGEKSPFIKLFEEELQQNKARVIELTIRYARSVHIYDRD
jgi:hypothetical protein